MKLRRILLIKLLLLRRRKTLLSELRARLSRGHLQFYPELSGRVAIYRLACLIASQTERRIALVPDYICNVVHRALEEAGFVVEIYQTDRFMEPLLPEITARLRRDDVAILLTASLFGSSALLPELEKENLRGVIRRSGAHVLVDLCQDISLIERLPTGYGDQLSAVVSFNDKSFPGAMGGGILAGFEIPEPPRRFTLHEQGLLIREMGRKWFAKTCEWVDGRMGGWGKTDRNPLQHPASIPKTFGKHPTSNIQYPPIHPSTHSPIFDYSHCRYFPYTFTPVAIAKIQLVWALAGLRLLPEINRRRARFVDAQNHLQKPIFAASAAYLIVEENAGDLPKYLRRKPSYACPEDPGRSARPELVIVHNPGGFR